tara:strand:+ start:13035 stop:13298 length:264 start_codon:yes stop_codon:yes gene_type:complete
MWCKSLVKIKPDIFCLTLMLRTAEVGRAVRFINILVLLWLIVAVLVIDTVPANALWVAIISGVALMALSFPKGKIREKYGTFDKYIV